MTTLTVLVIAMAVAAVLVVAEIVFSSSPPLDTERQARWLVRHAPAWLQPMLRHIDRRVAGGIMVAASFAAVLSGAVAVGLVFDSIDRDRGIARWDRSAAEWGAEHATPTSTRVISFLTELGSTRLLLVVMAALGLALVRRRGWGPLTYLAVVGCGVATLNNLLKWIVDRERPDIARLAGYSGSSFPSGHSAAAAACWAGIALVLCARLDWRRRAAGAAVATLIAAAVAASRVLLGVHWLTDVIAGAVVGWTWFFLSTIAFGGRLLRLGEPAERVERGSEAAAKAAVLAAEPTPTR